MDGTAHAIWSVVVGALSVATLPVAVAATRYSDAYELLHAGVAVPVGIALGAVAVALARQARARRDATIGRARGRNAARVGRVLGILGLCLACSGLVALAVYGLLTYVGSQE